MVKKLISPRLRVKLKVMQRHTSDLLTGQLHQFAQATPPHSTASLDSAFQPRIVITQSLGSTASQYLESKKHNLGLAIQRLQNVVINPGQIFSFWHLVGQPDQAAGYVEGRTITGDHIATTVGGGLCQLSGLIYLLALKSGLTSIERHSHSKDIYTESTRFAPLGADATIVYGYKDLRLKNNLLMPICFQFAMTDRQIQAAIGAPQPIAELKVEFKAESFDGGTKIDTIRYAANHDKGELIGSAIYPKLQVPLNLR